MPARSPQQREGRAFTAPEQLNQRRYEALRAFFVDGMTYAEAGERFGYTRWAMVNLVRDYRAGKLQLFAPPRKPGPPPGSAPAKERVRGRVIELRREGLSTYEISARLAGENTPLNRTSVGEPRKASGGCCATLSPSRAPHRPPSAATLTCRAPASWTSDPGPPQPKPARPGCCC